MLNFLSESSSDFVATETVGGFSHGSNKNTFDDIFTEAVNDLNAQGIDVMRDISTMIKKKAVLGAFKDKLLGGLASECSTMMEKAENEDEGINAYDPGTHAVLYEQVSQMFDNCVEDLIKESTRVGQLLPIKAIDFPILVKQQLKLATKDIMQTEVTNTPIVKKHLEQTYIVDNKTKTRWKYPQVFFTDDWKEIYGAGKGLPIKEEKVEFPIYNFHIPSELTDAEDPEREEFTMDLQIISVYVGDTEIRLGSPMRINLSDGMWLGGIVKKTVTDAGTGTEIEVDDIVMGTADFKSSTVTLSSAKGQITGVKFSGYLSNEKNERAVTFDYEREEREWKIEDGMRAHVSYSLEQLEDTKALMDIDLYQKTYNNLTEFMVQMEDSKILSWLDAEFNRWDGVEVSLDEILGWSPFITKDYFNFDAQYETTALPCEFIEKMLKFKIDGFITGIADKAKLDDITFVIYGNPNIIRFLNPVINWVTRPGSTVNGVKLDYGYGVMTSGDVKVQVVSTKKVRMNYDSNEKLFDGLRFIPYPLGKEQMTFKHFKYTSHILTSQNSAYRDADLPGGSQTYLLGVSRYTNASVQGIQADLKFQNAEKYITR